MVVSCISGMLNSSSSKLPELKISVVMFPALKLVVSAVASVSTSEYLSVSGGSFTESLSKQETRLRHRKIRPVIEDNLVINCRVTKWLNMNKIDDNS